MIRGIEPLVQDMLPEQPVSSSVIQSRGAVRNNWWLLVTLLRSGGLKVQLAQGNCVGKFKGKGCGKVFGNNQRQLRGFEGTKG